MAAKPLACWKNFSLEEQDALPNSNTLLAARSLLGMTQQDLANKAGVHENVVKNFERGATKARASTLIKFKDAFNKEGVVFLRRTEHYRMGLIWK